MITLPRKALHLALVAAAAGWLTGCATQPKTPEQAAQQAAQARWDALIKGDFRKAWSYLDADTRANGTHEEYARKLGKAAVWKDAQALRAQCQPAQCLVKVRLTVQNFAPGFAHSMPTLTTYYDEVWAREDGQWRFKGNDAAAAAGIVEDALPTLPQLPAAPAAAQ